MKVDIVKRLRDYADDDHERLCQGREYTCSCGYDDKREPLITEAADEITALRAENEKLRVALGDIHAAAGNNHLIANIARAALEEKP